MWDKLDVRHKADNSVFFVEKRPLSIMRKKALKTLVFKAF